MGSSVLSIMIVVWATVIVLLRRASKEGKANGKSAAKRNSSGSRKWYTESAPGASFLRRATRASDGHRLGADQDITCRQYGHNHPRSVEPESRYIVHEDPTEGYIVLNGKKMLRTEADKYENSI
ncbi:MAG: hypothetical protein IJ198_13385 [Lachnospiraceae bacterium]|nr:hypothetical protein [Lachnospiraceae bacterium]